VIVVPPGKTVNAPLLIVVPRAVAPWNSPGNPPLLSVVPIAVAWTFSTSPSFTVVALAASIVGAQASWIDASIYCLGPATGRQARAAMIAM
jgi:hypothetical protein